VIPKLSACLVAILAALAATSQASAQPDRLANAKPEVRSAAGGLGKTVHGLAAGRAEPAWLGYAAPVRGRHQMCCYGSLDRIRIFPCGGRCFLEQEDRSGTLVNSGDDECTDLGPDSDFLVLLRIERGEVRRIRALSRDCALDAGGLSFFWLTDVKPAESVAFLSGFVNDSGLERKKQKHSHEPALAAIAFHDDPSADAALEGFTAPGQTRRVREQAAFWLGNTRGKRGYQVLRRLAFEEPDEELRRHVTFALSQSEEPEALETLLAMAKKDESHEVRGQALFWLAQKAGEKAAEAIQDAIREDPEEEVKKKAVFALSQLPGEEAATQLIRVARTNRNSEVRKQAVFWLGQSKDPRALKFIEEILDR
jgi:hypothetical protein